MIECFQFCHNFALKFNLRRYTEVLFSNVRNINLAKVRAAKAHQQLNPEPTTVLASILTACHVNLELWKLLKGLST